MIEFNLFWILFLGVLVWLVKQNKNKVWNKVAGSFLIVFGLFIFSPLPSIDDLLMYPLLSSILGWQLSFEGIKANFLPYSIITAGIGLGIAWLGIYISGFKLRYLTNKIKQMFRRK